MHGVRMNFMERFKDNGEGIKDNGEGIKVKG